MPKDILVTTGDLKQEYDVIGPVYFQVSNKGLFSNQLSKQVNAYAAEIQKMKRQGQMSEFRADWGSSTVNTASGRAASSRPSSSPFRS